MTTTPPPPSYPPAIGPGGSDPDDLPLYIPTPITPTQAEAKAAQAADAQAHQAAQAAALDEAARRFWAPARKIAQDWHQAMGPDAHLTDDPVLPPVTGWEQPDAEPDATHRVADRIALILSETNKERAERLQAERDAAFARAGETQRQKTERHKREKHARQTRARRRQIGRELFDSALRAKRFNRWLLLTAASAALGFHSGLVQICGAVIRSSSDPVMGVGAGLFLTGLGYAVDWYLRGGATRQGGAVSVTEVRGRVRIPLLVVTRVPVASALTALLTYTPGSLFPHF
ncbi:hypothetical protein ACGF0D_43060 [Kitasatospora sp. NPDC048298]|uniref:hypothetical protein n=1 Tax=Kitasatospora sp. NPDC048298 TaxID=3364049 RepID=UPI00371E610E